MIDEVYEVKEYLDGKKITERGRYRAAYMIARWYTQEGCTFRETRDKIFEWAKRTDNFLKYNVNDIIESARNCDDRLKDNVTLYISETDVNRIVTLFDGKNTRKLALALLCYAKVYANKNKEFDVSLSALSEWCGVTRQHISHSYLPELIKLGYITKLDSSAITVWHRAKKTTTSKYAQTRLRIEVPLYNAGKFQLVRNDFKKLHNEIFEKTQRNRFYIEGENYG